MGIIVGCESQLWKGEIMLKILAIDPSGTGTTGICLINDKKITFQEFQSKDWKEHLDFIKGLVKKEKPALLIYENTHYIHQKTQDGLIH